MSIRSVARTRRVLATSCCAVCLLATVGCGAYLPERTTPEAVPPGSSPAGAKGHEAPPVTPAELNCNQTEDEYHQSGYVYLYAGEYCAGGNDAKTDPTGDADYGDGRGQVADFDNRADSIVNTTDSHIEFYNYPNHNEAAGDQGDRFCLAPGEWINRLQFYGDGGGTNDWWKDSISSHRKVAEADCDRWFGWGR